MSDLKRRLRDIEGYEPPDLWREIQGREPRALPGMSPRRRVLVVVVAIAVAVAGIGVAVRAFRSSPPSVEEGPVPAPRNGLISFGRGTILAGPSVPDAEIYVMNPDGSGVRKLTDAGAQGKVAAEAAWSPDGTKIAFVLSTPEHLGAYAGDGDIYVMNGDGTGLAKLTDDLRSAQPAWSPDGSRIVFVRDQGESLMVVNADGTGATRIRPDGEAFPPYQSPAWSPDGSRIAFQASPSPGVDTNHVYVTGIDGAGTTQVTTGPSDGSPAWSPDGNTLAYAGPDGIHLYDMQSGTDQRLTMCDKRQDCGFDFEPSWAPDGARIAFARQDYSGESVQIFVVNADGTELRQLTHGPAWNAEPSWQPIPTEGVSPRASTTGAAAGRCVHVMADGDFDGDGVADTATLYDVVPKEQTCHQDVSGFLHLSVRFGSGGGFDVPFKYCQGGACAGVFETIDLDADGRSELVTEVGPGAAIDSVEFFRVSAHGIRPLQIQAPGDQGYVEPGPALLGGGFDSGQQSPVSCEAGPDGTTLLVSVHAAPTGNLTTAPWNVHRTVLALQGDALTVVERSDSMVHGFSMSRPIFRCP